VLKKKKRAWEGSRKRCLKEGEGVTSLHGFSSIRTRLNESTQRGRRTNERRTKRLGSTSSGARLLPVRAEIGVLEDQTMKGKGARKGKQRRGPTSSSKDLFSLCMQSADKGAQNTYEKKGKGNFDHHEAWVRSLTRFFSQGRSTGGTGSRGKGRPSTRG